MRNPRDCVCGARLNVCREGHTSGSVPSVRVSRIRTDTVLVSGFYPNNCLGYLPSKYNALRQGISSQSIHTMHTTRRLASDEQTTKFTFPIRPLSLSFLIDRYPAHGIMKCRRDPTSKKRVFTRLPSAATQVWSLAKITSPKRVPRRLRTVSSTVVLMKTFPKPIERYIHRPCYTL